MFRHISTHLGIKFPCSTCHKSFSSKNYLEHHQKVACGPNIDEQLKEKVLEKNKIYSMKWKTRVAKCSYPKCRKMFTTKEKLEEHEASHQNCDVAQDSVICHLCGKSLKSSNLR